MNVNAVHHYVCPKTKGKLKLEILLRDGENVLEGYLTTSEGTVYEIHGGVPNFVNPFDMALSDTRSKAWYDSNAKEYEEYLHLTFDSFGAKEAEVRGEMIDKLCIGDNSTVLEVGAGTGRDSVVIAQRMQKGGMLFLQDISLPVLEMNIAKSSGDKLAREYHLGNACSLPFPNDFFDSAFHFGGLNTFSDISAFFEETNRVVKPGGKVVVGDEGVPVWLKDTEYAQILMNSNPNYKFDIPLNQLPTSCRKVRVEWILGEVFYVIDYVVGEGDPVADFDFEIPGARGGTHKTRFYGQLEGVTDEAKKLAHTAAVKRGLSMHAWLDSVVREAALREQND